MRLEWAERKAAANRAKHGIDFAVAITAFDDPFALVAPDAAHSTPREERRWLIGESDSGVLVVVFTIVVSGTSVGSSARGPRIERSDSDMSRAKSFPFEKARRATADETEAARKAIENKLGTKRPRRGRPPKGPAKYQAVSIRLSPEALTWAKKEAKRRGIGYQTVINETLLKASA